MKVSVIAGERVETRWMDPLLRGLDLPLHEAYYPLGYRAEITTNSPDVLEAAAESWGGYHPEFECQPVNLRIVVQPEGARADEPVFRQQGHLVSIVSDRENFMVGDLHTLAACGFVTRQTAADHAWFRWFFLESIVQISLEQRYTATVHAACVARNDAGVLLCGASGAGKSTLAYACARAGWTYVSDESAHLLLDGAAGAVLGKPHQVRFRTDAGLLFPELRQFAAKVRPSGKISVEVSTCQLPQIRTAIRCQISSVVFLARSPGRGARFERVPKTEAVAALLSEKPFFGEEAWVRHEAAVRRLAELPTYRLEYDQLDRAVEVLCGLVPLQSERR